MTDREFKAQRKRVRRLSKKWHRPLGLLWWNVTTVYDREPGPEFGDSSNGHIRSRGLAVTSVTWEYSLATISWEHARCRGGQRRGP